MRLICRLYTPIIKCFCLSQPIDLLLYFFLPLFSSSQNGSEYQDAYTAHRNSSLLNLDKNETNLYAQHCYDATWALAFALNRTITGKLMCLSVCLFFHTNSAQP